MNSNLEYSEGIAKHGKCAKDHQMTDILDNILNSHGLTSSFARQMFNEKSSAKSYAKADYLFIEGERNEQEYILVSGILHKFNISEKGNVITTGFYLPQTVITPHFVRTCKGKNISSIQTLTDSVIVELPVKELDNLRHTNREFQEFGQRVLEKEMRQTFLGEVAFRSLNAKERLMMMRKQYPNLENLVPHSLIASFLGITKVSFSRLRNELLKK